MRTLDMDIIALHHKSIKNVLPSDYILITSPFDLQSITNDTVVITIDSKEYTYDELMQIIEKAEMYDDLCK